MKQKTKTKNPTPANILTALRIILVAPFLYFLFAGSITTALIIFIAAALTDMIDGYIAKRFKQQTKFGAEFDITADGILIAAGLVSLTWLNYLPLRETIFFVIAGAILAFGLVKIWQRKKIVYTTPLGKISGILVYLVIILALLEFAWLKLAIWIAIVINFVVAVRVLRKAYK